MNYVDAATAPLRKTGQIKLHGSEAFAGMRPVYFEDEGFMRTPTYRRSALLAGNRIKGPALIEEYASTTVVHPGDVVTVDAFGDLVIEILRS